MVDGFAREFPRLVELIFDGAESPDGVAPALGAMAQLFEAECGHSLAIGASGIVETHIWANQDRRPEFAEYERHWVHQDPRQVAAAKLFGQVLSDVAVIDPHEFERSPIYNEHLRRSNVRYSLFANTRLAPDLELGQAFLRRPVHGPFGPEHVQALEMLLPHLRRALQLRLLVASMRDELADLRRALDAVPGAVAIVDGNAKIVCANAAAERLLATRDGLASESGKLSAVRSVDAQRLAATVRETARFAEGASVGLPSTRVVRITRNDARPLGVVLAPLRPTSAVRQNADRAARVLVVIHDPEAKHRLDPALIAELHGFTEVEALLAAALARGLSLAEFAVERGCSEHTARTHLKRMLEKSGTHRQSDLVRVLLGSAALHLASR